MLAIGLAHFLMPTIGYAPSDLAAIPAPQKEHFVFLGTYAIAFFLVSFAVMTLMADQRAPTWQMTVFLGLMTVVWCARFVLEILYPVTLPLFFAPEPHAMLLAAILIIWAAYVVGFVGHVRALKTSRGTPPATPIRSCPAASR